MRKFFKSAALAFVGGTLAWGLNAPVSAAAVTALNYTYSVGPNYYDDSTGKELIDGAIATGSFANSCCDWSRYVGFQNANGSVVFNFGSQVRIDTVSLWLADDDGYAGVSLPSSASMSMGGVTRTRSVSNVAGTAVRRYDFDGLGLMGSSLTLTLARSTEWVMLSEVQFANSGAVALPEPASPALVAVALAGLAAGAYRRRRFARR